MGIDPRPVMMVCVIAYIAQTLILLGGVVLPCDDEGADPDNCIAFPAWDGSGGFFGFLVDAFDIVQEATAFAWQFVSFGIVGLPWYIGTPIAMACLGTFTIYLISVFRGN